MIKRTLALVVVGAFLASCSSQEGGTAQENLGDMKNGKALTNSALQSFTVPSGAASVTLMVNGGMSETDMDISYLKGPDGYVYVTEPWNDADNGGLSQKLGDSTVTLTIPNGDYSAPLSGVWEYKTGCERCQGVTEAISYKTGAGSNLNVNVILVSQPDISSANDPNLQEVISEFKNEYAANGFNVADIKYWIIDSGGGAISTSDGNGNGQFDGMDQLFNNVTPGLPDGYINVFLVRSIGSAGILGISGGIPGPPVNGTPHSGVIVSTLGGLSGLSSADRRMQGNTMAHEMGHYYGLFHTTERSGTSFDPISDTAQCGKSRDSDGSGSMSAEECAGAGGDNLMFWQAPVSGLQTRLSAGQRFVLGRAANIY
ncbi:hypothetical protein MNBD_NITROSPINAE02-46 [hydrothermal vent metagenome]|uniref:Peptidase M43 pregnancy-associated plasma-A domain-containing protein n=1 Tax=hydrothermal vent metagenome TaxID=652676 RepID=A0A3B1BMF4_9ZZZZ